MTDNQKTKKIYTELLLAAKIMTESYGSFSFISVAEMEACPDYIFAKNAIANAEKVISYD